MKFLPIILLLCFHLAGCAASNPAFRPYASPPISTTNKKQVSIRADLDWQSTGVNIAEGDTVFLDAYGAWNGASPMNLFALGWVGNGPSGGTGMHAGLIFSGEPSPTALIGRIGSNVPFSVRDQLLLTSKESGELFLRMNDPTTGDNSGAISVNIYKENNNHIATNQLGLKENIHPILSDIDRLPPIVVKKQNNSYAIIIGIENYRQKLPKADFATNDATTVSNYLVKTLGYPEENVITLTNDHATKSDLEKYLSSWLKNNVEKDSNVFIYYSGHGAPNPKNGDAYLVPYDGDPAFIADTGYSLKQLYANLAKLPAKQVIVALDSCFSGAGGKSVAAPGSRALVRTEKTTASNLVVMTASADDQISSTYMDKVHGIFTYFLLKGIKESLEGDQNNRLQVGDLYAYLKPQVESMSRKKFNSEQTPQLITANDQMRKIGLR